MGNELDILADLDRTPSRPSGVPCAIEALRRDRPDLALQWDRVIEAKRTKAISRSNTDIAEWFAARNATGIDRQLVGRHVARQCKWCQRTEAAAEPPVESYPVPDTGRVPDEATLRRWRGDAA